MDDELQRALEGIDQAVAWLEEVRKTPIVLSEEYLDLVRRVEELPQNQSGADKTWVERSRVEFERHVARARLLR